MFGQTYGSGRYTEVITVIPSSLSKLWGSVQRGVQELFGFDSEISVNSTSEDTLTVVSVNLSANFEHQLSRSKAYENLNAAQDYEAYLVNGEGGDATCFVLKDAGDARIKMSTENFQDYLHGDGTEEVNFVMKQNMSQVIVRSENVSYVTLGVTFPTAYPIIYRMGNVWLRYAQALNGAGFPGYAFAILKSGLCGNSRWLPTSEKQYEPKSYVYFDESEITAAGDTTFYTTYRALMYHVYQSAVAADTTFAFSPANENELYAIFAKGTEQDEEGNFINPAEHAFYESFDGHLQAISADLYMKATDWENWMSESNTSVVCNHISKWEMKAAKAAPYLNFSTLYLRGDAYLYGATGGQTQYQLTGTVLYPNNNGNFNGEGVTAGIHTRGCGHIFFNEQNTTFNYIDQINKMRTQDGEATMTKAEIYDQANLPKVQKAIAHLILDELALETAFEGNRFYDLVCYSRFCNSADELAKRVANRTGNTDGSLYSYLQNEKNWYFKLPQK